MFQSPSKAAMGLMYAWVEFTPYTWIGGESEPHQGRVWRELAICWWLHLCLCFLAQDSGIDIGDISARKALRKQLQCKTFRWYLVSVYPEMRMYSDIIAYGVVSSPPPRAAILTQNTRLAEEGEGGNSSQATCLGPVANLETEH